MGLLAFFLGFLQGWSSFLFLLKVSESGACMFEQGKLVCECKAFLTSTHNPLMYIIYLGLRANYLFLSWVISRSKLRSYKAKKSKKEEYSSVCCLYGSWNDRWPVFVHSHHFGLPMIHLPLEV